MTSNQRPIPLTAESYRALYKQSITDPLTFWHHQASQFLTWFTPWKKTVEGDFSTGHIDWFVEGQLNACYNCIDRHLPDKKDKVAFYWEGNQPGQSQIWTYQALYEAVGRFANALKAQGVKRGSRVCIYLPMIPELVISMLACARIGAIHTVVFAGFSPESLKNRLLDAECSLLITASYSFRENKIIPLKAHADQAVKHCSQIKHIIVVQQGGENVPWDSSRDRWYHELIEEMPCDCPIESMDANDPLFILYTSGSTGKPKGVVHRTGGYLLYTAMTFFYVFNYQQDDVFWCTADAGWITGHSYLVYGPLLNGATLVLFEGVPTYPTPSRYWEIVDTYQVTIFYTSPTAIRALRKEGDAWVNKTSRQSLRLLGSVGEPINPEVWQWYATVIGNKRCPIVDTWWQTETGGIVLSSLPGASLFMPGCAGVPFFGIEPIVIDEQGKRAAPQQKGRLFLHQAWPGLMKTIYNDHERFIKTYLQPLAHHYYTGDGAYYDEKGYFWLTGRDDDVIKISGHRLGSEELESALLLHPAVAEAAVVGIDDKITGEAIYAFVTLKKEKEYSLSLNKELVEQVRQVIGPIAKISFIQWTLALPKTRSGKIMRRLLRQIAQGELNTLGDTSTLANPEIIDNLINNRLIQ